MERLQLIKQNAKTYISLGKSPSKEARAVFEIDRAVRIAHSLVVHISTFKANKQEEDQKDDNDGKLVALLDQVQPLKISAYLEDHSAQARILGRPDDHLTYERFTDIVTDVFETYIDIHRQLRIFPECFV